MICIYSDDLNTISMWEESLEEYKILDNIKDCDLCEIVLIDLQTKAKEFLSYLKINKNIKTKFITLEPIPNEEMAKTLLNHGVKAYGNSYMLSIHLKSCIQTVKEGNIWIYPDFIYTLIGYLNNKNQNNKNSTLKNRLTKREKEISTLVLEGYNNEEIAKKLNISLQTTKIHLSNIYKKLHISSRLELAIKLK